MLCTLSYFGVFVQFVIQILIYLHSELSVYVCAYYYVLILRVMLCIVRNCYYECMCILVY